MEQESGLKVGDRVWVVQDGWRVGVRTILRLTEFTVMVGGGYNATWETHVHHSDVFPYPAGRQELVTRLREDIRRHQQAVEEQIDLLQDEAVGQEELDRYYL